MSFMIFDANYKARLSLQELLHKESDGNAEDDSEITSTTINIDTKQVQIII